MTATTQASSILPLFESSGALLRGHFKLTSGRHSDVYYEKFNILKQPTICTEVCRSMAESLRQYAPTIIVGPTTGGIIIAYDVARYLGLDAYYAEAGEAGGRVFKRGFELTSADTVAIVDDVLTTGTSLQEVIDLVKPSGAKIVALGAFLDRSNGKCAFSYPLISLATVAAESWSPEDCPICKRGEPLTQRGSRQH